MRYQFLSKCFANNPVNAAKNPAPIVKIKTPVAPKDCKIANKDPAETSPIEDCSPAANEPAAIPAGQNPIKVIINAIMNKIIPVIIKNR